MKSIHPLRGLAATAIMSLLLTTIAHAEHSAASTLPASSSSSDLIARGQYLVHRTGLCIDCHSPRDEKGEFLPGKHLTGAILGFGPLVPMPWVPAAPRLAGIPAGFTEAELTQFLMTGERPNGRPPALPPMPAYRFERTEAEAVVAYLRTLPVTGGE